MFHPSVSRGEFEKNIPLADQSYGPRGYTFDFLVSSQIDIQKLHDTLLRFGKGKSQGVVEEGSFTEEEWKQEIAAWEEEESQLAEKTELEDEDFGEELHFNDEHLHLDDKKFDEGVDRP